MNIKRIVIFLFTSCMVQIGVYGEDVSASHGIYAYNDFSLGSGLVIDESRHSVLNGDTGVPATFCDEKSEYFCVNSDYLNFAVPRKLTHQTKSWTMNGYLYTIALPLMTKRFLGKDVDIEIITLKQLSDKTHKIISYFYYSPTYGLLGIIACTELQNKGSALPPNNDFPVVVLAANEHGFGVLQ